MTPERIAELRASADYGDDVDRQGELIECLDEIERLQADLDRKMGRRSDCKVCGEKVPFVGAVVCSEQCWRKAEEESHAS